MLSVIVYNIHYGEKIEKLKEWFIGKKSEFDIICFQEFPLAYIDTFLSDIKGDVFGYRYSHGFTKKGNKYGQVTLWNTKKIQILDDTVLTLGSSILERSGRRGERSALITQFRYNKKKFFMVNAHLVCFALNQKRILQLEKIITHLKKVSTEEAPLIIVEDLNYSSLIRQQRLLDFMDQYGFSNAYKTRSEER